MVFITWNPWPGAMAEGYGGVSAMAREGGARGGGFLLHPPLRLSSQREEPSTIQSQRSVSMVLKQILLTNLFLIQQK